MAFDPSPTAFDYDDPETPEGAFSSGARGVSNSIATAQAADPLKGEIRLRTQRKADLGRTKQALDQLEGTFLSTEGGGLFQLDEKGQPFKNADGTYVPDMGARVESLRARSLGQVGFVKGALTPGVARGDKTNDALAAQQELSQIEPAYEAKRQKWERIQEQRAMWKHTHDRNELELGALSAERLAQQGLFMPTQPQQQAPMGQPATAADSPMSPAATTPAQAQDPIFLGEVGKNATDLAASFGSGSNALLKMAGDLYGLASGNFENWLSEQGKYGMDHFERMKSPEMLAKQTERKAAIDAAPDELGKALAFVKSTVMDPMLFASTVVEQVPNTVGTGSVGLVMRKGAEKLLLRKAATEAAKALAEKQAIKVGVGAAVGAGAAMQGADVGGDQYGQLLVEMERMTKPQLEKIPEIAELVKRGASIDEAKMAYALTQARKTGAVAGAISLAAQALPGGATIEKTLAGGVAGRSVRGRLAGALVGGVGEAVSESIEEGGGQFASNVFAQGVDPTRKLTQGVGEAVGQAIVTAGPMGAGAGALNGGADPEAQIPPAQQTPPGQPQTPPTSPPAALAQGAPSRSHGGYRGWGPQPPPAALAQGAPLAPSAAPIDNNEITVDPELQAELDAETEQSAAPKAPISTQGGPAAQTGLIRQPSVGSTPTPAPTQSEAKPASPFNVSSPEVKAAWGEGSPPDEAKTKMIQDAIATPGVTIGYSIFEGRPGQPRPHQVDLLGQDGGSLVGTNIYDLARLGFEAPIPPADIKTGNYTREQIEEEIAKRGTAGPQTTNQPTATETPQDVIQKPQRAQATDDEIDDGMVAAAERETDPDKEETEPINQGEDVAPEKLDEVALKSVLRVTFKDGTVIEGNYTIAQGNGYIRDKTTNEIHVLTGGAAVEREGNPTARIVKLRDGMDVQAEQDGRKFGKLEYTQPKTRDEYENTLWDLATKANQLRAADSYNQDDFKRSLQLDAQFEKLADQIELSKIKRRYLFAQANRRANGQPLQNPNEFSEGPLDALRFGVPRITDFDPNPENRKKNRAALPVFAYPTKAEVEASLADARLKGQQTKSPQRRKKMAQIIQLRQKQLATGKYREAVENGLAEQPSPNGQDQKVPTEAPQGQVGGQKPASVNVRSGAGTSVTSLDVKEPAISRGSNTPAKLAQVASQVAGLKENDAAAKFLRDFAPRLHNANPAAFADMELNVLTDAEWKTHPSLSKSNPNSPAAFNVGKNILYLNSDKVKGGEAIAEAIVHEAGHFAEIFALGEAFTQQQWESLTDLQREDSARSYSWDDGRTGAELKDDRRARAEWVAMQFTRVVKGDTVGMNPTVKERLSEWLEIIRALVKRWVGNERLSTPQLDAKILEILGYADSQMTADSATVTTEAVDFDTGNVVDQSSSASEAVAESERAVTRYESLLDCLKT